MAPKRPRPRRKPPKDDEEYAPGLSKKERASRHRQAQAAYLARKAEAARKKENVDPQTRESVCPESPDPTPSPTSPATPYLIKCAAPASALLVNTSNVSSREDDSTSCSPRSVTTTISSLHTHHTYSGPPLHSGASDRVQRAVQAVAILNAGPLTPPSAFARSFWVRGDHRDFVGEFLNEEKLADIKAWIWRFEHYRAVRTHTGVPLPFVY
ncbi:hypothetical protein R3P38DRAFT_3175420 [Favolaschia claudopus]|uniref:BZIP domain-containing protein n=1 Tax=Favolaschia claudopus TaxID=2862362 RepID=A0AAW0DA35_9AGAR